MQLKKQKIRKVIRRQAIEEKINEQRARQQLYAQLEALLVNYQKCALVNAQDQFYPHQCYLDCEYFVVQQHQNIFELIQKLGVSEVKLLLLKYSLPKKIAQVKEFVEDKTLEFDEKKLNTHLVSKNKVLSSISKLFGMFTQEEELNKEIYQQIINLFCLQLRMEFPFKSETSAKLYYPLVGLINMFYYQSYQHDIYVGLKQINFQMILQKHFQRTIHFKQDTCDELSSNLIVLFRYYLQYQSQKTDQMHWKPFLKTVGEYAIYSIDRIIAVETHFGKDIEKNEMIDELLKICLWTNIDQSQRSQIIKKKELFRKRMYTELLQFWTENYNTQINLNIFTNQELEELLETLSLKVNSSDFERYRTGLAAAFINMLIAEDTDNESAHQRVWSLLCRTRTNQLLADGLSQNEEVYALSAMLKVYIQEV